MLIQNGCYFRFSWKKKNIYFGSCSIEILAISMFLSTQSQCLQEAEQRISTNFDGNDDMVAHTFDAMPYGKYKYTS